MKKVFYLSSCSTCQRILKEVKAPKSIILQDIKEKNINAKELDFIAEISGSYESVFSKRAMKYRAWGLHDKKLSEKDYRDLILKEYTFLRRPVYVDGNLVFVGNGKKVIEEAKKHFNHK